MRPMAPWLWHRRDDRDLRRRRGARQPPRFAGAAHLARLAHLACPDGTAGAQRNAVVEGNKELYRRPEGIPFPPENRYTAAKEKLGRMLFFDPILSGARDISCSSCHNPSLSWADGKKLATGAEPMQLRTPSIIDVAWVPMLGWDGKYPSLESVAFGPLLTPANMNNTEAEIIRRLTRIPGYLEAFAQAFPDRKPGDEGGSLGTRSLGTRSLGTRSLGMESRSR